MAEKKKHLGRISEEVHAAIIKAAQESHLKVDDLLWILIRNWQLSRENE